MSTTKVNSTNSDCLWVAVSLCSACEVSCLMLSVSSEWRLNLTESLGYKLKLLPVREDENTAELPKKRRIQCFWGFKYSLGQFGYFSLCCFGAEPSLSLASPQTLWMCIKCWYNKNLWPCFFNWPLNKTVCCWGFKQTNTDSKGEKTNSKHVGQTVKLFFLLHVLLKFLPLKTVSLQTLRLTRRHKAHIYYSSNDSLITTKCTIFDCTFPSQEDA